MLRACRYTFVLTGVVYGGKYFFAPLFFGFFCISPQTISLRASLMTVVEAKYIYNFFIAKNSFLPSS